MSLSNRPMLIVGGGHGLGRELACSLVARGIPVTIADISISDDSRLHSSNIQFIPINLAQGDLSVLYNLNIRGIIITAGIGRLSWFETFPEEEIEKCFQINTLTTMKLVRAYYSFLDSSQPFPFAVVSSIAGLLASPLYAIYSASKAALVKFVEAINAELTYKERKNQILDIAPGRIDGTAFHGQEEKRGEKEQAELTRLTDMILHKMEVHANRYIPRYNDIYSNVLKRYAQSPLKFANDSIKYKLETQKVNPCPQITVGYLTGSFDLFHIGHLNLLRNARKYCDKLVVGVHRDGSHKGKTLFVPLEERMAIVKSVRFVNDVIVCSDEDMDDWVRVHFNFLFVGSDYKGTERFARYERQGALHGVRIIYLPYTNTTSSTQLRAVISQHSVTTTEK